VEAANAFFLSSFEACDADDGLSCFEDEVSTLSSSASSTVVFLFLSVFSGSAEDSALSVMVRRVRDEVDRKETNEWDRKKKKKKHRCLPGH